MYSVNSHGVFNFFNFRLNFKETMTEFRTIWNQVWSSIIPAYLIPNGSECLVHSIYCLIVYSSVPYGMTVIYYHMT